MMLSNMHSMLMMQISSAMMTLRQSRMTREAKQHYAVVLTYLNRTPDANDIV